ncbi:MAG: nucleotide exchange factor GrpE [Planctomycetota bacterium]
MAKTTNHPVKDTAVVKPPKTDNSPDVEAVGKESTERAMEIAELKAKIAALEDGVVRARADFQNLQRRSANERSEAIRFANAELIRSLLGVVDDLERTLSAAENDKNAGVLIAGVRLARDSFLKALRDNGLEPIDALHQPFDPELHNALMQQPTAEHPAGTVLQEVSRGYRLKERVLRPSTVIVASAPRSSECSEDHPSLD